MKYTEQDLENLINSILDKELTCDELPNICSLLASEQGRQRVVDEVKKKILNEGFETVDAALGHIEETMSGNND